MMAHAIEKPGAWEKFEVIKINGIDAKHKAGLFHIKSFHNKYMRCSSDGRLVADWAGQPGAWEEFILF